MTETGRMPTALAIVLFAIILIAIISISILFIWAVLKGIKKMTRTAYKKKLISLPVMFIPMIPAFMLFLKEQLGYNLNEEFWYAAFGISILAVVVISIFQCGFSGIWMGPVRACLGAMGGILAGIGFGIMIGAILIMGVNTSGKTERRIIITDENGKKRELYFRNNDESVAYDDRENLYICYSSYVKRVNDGKEFNVI